MRVPYLASHSKYNGVLMMTEWHLLLVQKYRLLLTEATKNAATAEGPIYEDPK